MKKFSVFFFVLAVLCAGCHSTGGTASPYTVTSVYEGVDWVTFGQYKAGLHAHTINSTESSGIDPLSSVIFEHYDKGYHILAITDHNFLTESWVSAPDGITQEQYDAIANGTYKNRGFGMLEIPDSNEQSRREHVNTFMVKYNNANPAVMDMAELIAHIESLGGLSHVNHPGRYTGGMRENPDSPSDASFDAARIDLYTKIFMANPFCVGMEIINKKDDESRSDRILWDNILQRTIPQGRNVWCFSSDDTHANADTGFSFNIFVMPENTLENFRAAMYAGHFYAVARVARREGFPRLGPSDNLTIATPAITGIIVENPGIISITAENHTRIDWISNGNVIFTGDTINVNNVKGPIGSYVRANVIGPGGVAFTQPFVIEK